ncbi:MFS transporter [Vandammella animalimorsus]|uniref:MFS transporter n=1 Tax=Vandammella animalimorsus TaxID=2029117 RepID=A0A2A2T2Q6_9BURK|nr:MFS transporter [Vandammella animalimorsus]PAT30630.1 MFS transporter [Vandammella animalimorsus]PAX15738.1 MFS transporter [Vandammella animalimorsus]PAX19622.1 MFS transporter [Vandammella animalimorsus]
MLPSERRTSLVLAGIFVLRMLGLFLVLPVFSLAAADYQGGDDPRLIGLAMGIYGLTQALLQWPLGMASDRWGRKRVIAMGLLVFVLGSVWAALSHSVWGLVAGRALQGAGAISAAMTALLADATREVVRTKAMALIGISIGASFSLALILGPLLGSKLGLSGLFWLMALLAGIALLVVLKLLPRPKGQQDAPVQHIELPAHAAETAAQTGRWALWRLNLGVFVLHLLQMAMWSGVPLLLQDAGLASAAHWQLYLPAVLLSVLCFGAVFSLERRGRLQWAMRLAMGLILAAQLALATFSHYFHEQLTGQAALWFLGAVLFVFFCGFNALEAMQPSLVSRLAPAAQRGSAMGVYSTLQSLGLFAGGVVGGALVAYWAEAGLFAVTALIAAAWCALTLWCERVPQHTADAARSSQP